MQQRFSIYVKDDAPGCGWIRDELSGELMHPLAAPFDEANAIYVQQSGLKERLQSGEQAPLVLWDVGLGAAANAMAALSCAESLESCRPLHIVSFELDTSALELALSDRERFRYLNHSAPEQILSSDEWVCPLYGHRWSLHRGDFLELSRHAPVPEVVFFDPFSYRTDMAVWTLQCFRGLFMQLRHRSTILITYSTSTAIRAALLVAGFWVGKGRGIGSRPESTCAGTPDIGGLESVSLLDLMWIERWKRSSAQYPADVQAAENVLFAEILLSHPQFSIFPVDQACL
jgi:queuine tRNA-ribosyltransferase